MSETADITALKHLATSCLPQSSPLRMLLSTEPDSVLKSELPGKIFSWSSLLALETQGASERASNP